MLVTIQGREAAGEGACRRHCASEGSQRYVLERHTGRQVTVRVFNTVQWTQHCHSLRETYRTAGDCQGLQYRSVDTTLPQSYRDIQDGSGHNTVTVLDRHTGRQETVRVFNTVQWTQHCHSLRETYRTAGDCQDLHYRSVDTTLSQSYRDIQDGSGHNTATVLERHTGQAGDCQDLQYRSVDTTLSDLRETYRTAGDYQDLQFREDTTLSQS
ncbi:hypothetical protein RRG08_053593 [Elysia crispata]|uniref:Uncharacterized protein n=1 Tax=Elysia crispata TaxID=231223 RepID=A0AAE1CQS1_9GAST|nr:hypothetical protein RRG08_053593 [Elysia crispata]